MYGIIQLSMPKIPSHVVQDVRLDGETFADDVMSIIDELTPQSSLRTVHPSQAPDVRQLGYS